MPLRSIVDKSITYNVAGSSNTPPQLVAVCSNTEFEEVLGTRMAGTLHRFQPRRSAEMLVEIEIEIENVDVDVDLDVSRSVVSNSLITR